MRKERNEKKEEEEGIGIGSREQNGITLNGQRPFGTFPKINPFWKGSASLRGKLLFLANKIRIPPQKDVCKTVIFLHQIEIYVLFFVLLGLKVGGKAYQSLTHLVSPKLPPRLLLWTTR